MPELRALLPEDVDPYRAAVRQALKERQFENLFSGIDPGSYGTTALNLQMLEKIETGLALLDLLQKRIESLPLPGLPPLTRDLFCGFAASSLLIDNLKKLAGDEFIEPPQVFKLEELQLIFKAPGTLPGIVDDLRAYISFYLNHPDPLRKLDTDRKLLLCVLSYFSLLKNSCLALAGDPAYSKTAELLFEKPFQILSWEFPGFRAVRKDVEEPTELLDVSTEDVVGNREFLEAGIRLAEDIAGFDLKSNKNPKRVRNQILFALGSPGCGKTVSAHAIGRHFLNLCKKHSVPARFRIIRKTDWASHYQNKSANELLRIFKEEIFGFPGVCGAYWADIDTAFGSRDDADTRQEEKNNLGTLFGILDGTVGPKDGKWFLICDANTQRMDSALLSRLSQQPLIAHGPQTPEDYVRLLRDIKLKGKNGSLKVTDKEWKEFGEFCVSNRLTGRSIDAAAGKVLAKMESFKLPGDYFSLSYEEKHAFIQKNAVPVSFSELKEMINDYCRFEKEADERARNEALNRRAEEIRLALKAHQLAAKNP